MGKLLLKILAVLALPLAVPLAGSGAVLVRDDGAVYECSLAGSGPLSGTTVAGEAFRAGLDGVTWIAGRDQKRIRLRNGSLIRVGAFDDQSLVCEGRLGNVALFAWQIVFYYSGDVELSSTERLVLIESGGQLQVTALPPGTATTGASANLTVYLLPENWDENVSVRLSDPVHAKSLSSKDEFKVQFTLALGSAEPKIPPAGQSSPSSSSYQWTLLPRLKMPPAAAPASSRPLQAAPRVAKKAGEGRWEGWTPRSQPLASFSAVAPGAAGTGGSQSLEVSFGSVFSGRDSPGEPERGIWGEGELYLYVAKTGSSEAGSNVIIEQTASNVLRLPVVVKKADSAGQ